MSEYRKGVENIPLREINKSKMIMVIVMDLNNNDEVVLEKKIDYASYEDRKWLGRISFWAFENHHCVETMAICDVEVRND